MCRNSRSKKIARVRTHSFLWSNSWGKLMSSQEIWGRPISISIYRGYLNTVYRVTSNKEINSSIKIALLSLSCVRLQHGAWRRCSMCPLWVCISCGSLWFRRILTRMNLMNGFRSLIRRRGRTVSKLFRYSGICLRIITVSFISIVKGSCLILWTSHCIRFL